MIRLTVLLALAILPAAEGPPPQVVATYDATGEVRALVPREDGLWIATTNGVRILSKSGQPSPVELPDGLALAEVRGVIPQARRIPVLTDRGIAVLGTTETVPCDGAATAAQDRTGAWWFGAGYTLVQVYGTARTLWGSRVGAIRRLFVVGDRVYAGGADGLMSFHGQSWESETRRGFPSHAWVTDAAVVDGRPVVATIERLYRLEDEAWQPFGPADARVLAANDTRILLATRTRIVVLDRTGEQIASVASPGVVSALALNGDRAIVGTESGEVFDSSIPGWSSAQRNAQQWRRLFSEASPPPEITAVALDGVTLWCGSFRGEVAFRRGNTWKREPRFAPPGEGITHLAAAKGEVWARLSNGKLVQRSRSGKWPTAPGAPKWISSLGSTGGALYVGTPGRAFVRENDRWTAVVPKGAGKSTVTSALRSHGGWWIGTQHGLYREIKPGVWRRYGLGTSLPDEWITALTEWRGSVYAGTFNGGVVRFEGTLAGETMNGAPSRVTSLAGGAKLWCGASDGLSVWDGKAWSSVNSGRRFAEGVTALATLKNQALAGGKPGLSLLE